jgi:hypothetical protein
MHGTRNNSLHDVTAVANAIMRIQNNLKSIQQDISFIHSQMDEIHKDVFHHLPVSEDYRDKKQSPEFLKSLAKKREKQEKE